MPESATVGFRREPKPIGDVFEPGAKPEACVADAPTHDEWYSAPFTETGSSRLRVGLGAVCIDKRFRRGSGLTALP